MFMNLDNQCYFVIRVIVLISCLKNGLADKKCNKIIIDTDAGGDDAVAIAQLILANQIDSPPTEILGITCVAGNTKVENVVVNVLKILRVLNATDIPVFMGANRPLLRNFTFDFFYGQDGLGDVNFPNPPTIFDVQNKSGVNALVDITSQYPGEVTVIALGPLTNIALASRISSDFRSNLKNLHVLGGILDETGTAPNGAEFNFYFDPEAAFTVFNDTTSQIKPVIQLTTDVKYTEMIPLEWRWNTLAKIDSPIIKFFNEIDKKVWQSSRVKYYIPFDGFVAAAFISSDVVVSTERYCEEVLYCGEDNYGKVIVKNDSACYQNANVIREIDTKVFMNLLINLFSI